MHPLFYRSNRAEVHMDTIPELPDPGLDEQQKITNWRLAELLRAGYANYREALEIAENRDIDLHDAIQMVAQGCDPHTAWRILT